MTKRGSLSVPSWEPWELHPVSQPLSRFQPVLAVTLLRRQEREWEILTGVRTKAANETRPGVVSVPTLRLPRIVAESWIDGLRDPGGTAFRAGHATLREVTNLLARKLGVADPLELGLMRLRQLDLDAWQGTSVIGEDQDGPVTEDLTMFNACVEVTTGSALFPGKTASYDPLIWARVDDFLRMARTREVAHLNAGLNPLQFCVYGLCLTSTARILNTRRETAGDIFNDRAAGMIVSAPG